MRLVYALAICFALVGILWMANSTFFQNQSGLKGPVPNAMEIEKTFTGIRYTLFTGHYHGHPIKVTRFLESAPSKAKDMVDNRMRMISSLYIGTDSPYPDLLSNNIRCGDEFKPRIVSHAPFDYYVLYTTNRYTYGPCSWDLISFQSILYFQICEDALYQLELFLPLEENPEPFENDIVQTEC